MKASPLDLVAIAVIGILAGCFYSGPLEEGTIIRKWQIPAHASMEPADDGNGDLVLVNHPHRYWIQIRKGDRLNALSISRDMYFALNVGDYVNYRSP